MPASTHLEDWVQVQYHLFGIDRKGLFIGKKLFKARLIETYNANIGGNVPKLEIRQLVNSLAVEPQQKPHQNIQNPRPTRPSTNTEPSELGLSKSISTLDRDHSDKRASQVITDEPSSTAASHPAGNWGTPPQSREAVKVNKFDTSIQDLDRVFQIQASLNPKLQELKRFTESSIGQGSDGNHRLPSLEDQEYLLDSNDESGHVGEAIFNNISGDAVIFSANLSKDLDLSIFPQYGLLGQSCLAGQSSLWPASEKDRRLFHNTNVPFSAFICGLQGSGKSHTLSCLLENCLIPTPMLGYLQRPLSALVLHFGQYNSRQSFTPCEAAFLGCPNPQFPNIPCAAPVNILVPPSNYYNLKASYAQIPGVSVHAFRLRPRDLNVSSILTLMSVDQSQSAPLYIGQITKVLREMASTSPNGFDYSQFKRRLRMSNLTRAQQGPLQQRLDLLESFLAVDNSAPSWTFASGGVTIIDLSCPFVDANMACILFNIGIRLYLESGLTNGKVIAIDEAHKYMTDTPASKVLTESLLSIIRQQRHFGARVIISSQEPTISPRLMDLCSMTMVHRFTSPEWFSVLRRHIFTGEDQKDADGLLRRISNLGVGQALLFAPSTLLYREDGNTPETLGSDLLQIKVRKRVTWDGGKSIVCV